MQSDYDDDDKNGDDDDEDDMMLVTMMMMMMTVMTTLRLVIRYEFNKLDKILDDDGDDKETEPNFGYPKNILSEVNLPREHTLLILTLIRFQVYLSGEHILLITNPYHVPSLHYSRTYLADNLPLSGSKFN